VKMPSWLPQFCSLVPLLQLTKFYS
jgi:hypothetical protein